jgi:hypothetical protein
MLFLKLTALLCLGSILYLDFKYRAVYWIIFPILSIALAFLKQMQVGTETALIDTGWNVIFFSIQLLLLWFYFSVKDKRVYSIVNSKLGLGDILFLTSVSLYLSPLNYCAFYIVSLLFTLCFVCFSKVLKGKMAEIPLAGLQALGFALLLVAELFCRHFALYKDIWLINTLFMIN